MKAIGNLSKVTNKVLTKIVKGPISRYLSISPNKVVVYNFFGNGYGDSPKYIVEKLLQSDRDLDIVWIVSDLSTKMPKGVRKVKYGSFQSMYELATAKVIIGNVKNFSKPKKKQGQFYLQTWHGGIALKKIEKDALPLLSNDYVRASMDDSSMIDLLISNSKFFTKIFRNAFWYDGRIAEVGLPRSDIFFEDPVPYGKKIREYFGIDANTKLVLYAPTFRDNGDTSSYNVDFNKLVSTLEDMCNCDWAIIVRMHPNARDYANKIRYTDKVINGSVSIDTNELILGSDIILTDYSSVMFDGMLAKKQVYLYTPDLEQYIKDRGMYFSIQELPFPLAKNNLELIKNLCDSKLHNFIDNYSNFEKKIGLVEDGHASEKIALILENELG